MRARAEPAWASGIVRLPGSEDFGEFVEGAREVLFGQASLRVGERVDDELVVFALNRQEPLEGGFEPGGGIAEVLVPEQDEAFIVQRPGGGVVGQFPRGLRDLGERWQYRFDLGTGIERTCALDAKWRLCPLPFATEFVRIGRLGGVKRGSCKDGDC